VHPFLFATPFVVYLLAQHLDDQVPLGDVLAVLAVALAATAAVMLALLALPRNLRLAAAMTTVGVLWVCLYEFASDFETGDGDGDWLLVRHWAFIGLIALGVVILLQKHTDHMTQVLNFVAALLLAFNLFPVVPHQIASATAPSEAADQRVGSAPAVRSSKIRLPSSRIASRLGKRTYPASVCGSTTT
jgi:hypothetical protein